MSNTAQINVNFDSALKKAGISPATLKPGDTLRVRVLDFLSDGRIRADFESFRANAEITFAVKRGEELFVRVIETGRQLRFSVIPPGQSSAGGTDGFLEALKLLSDEQYNQIRSDIRQIFDQVSGTQQSRILAPSILNAIAQIKAHFSTLIIHDNISKLASDLKAYIENSGIFFENRVKDALAILMDKSEQLFLKNTANTPEIREILLRDLKPNLLLLKEFVETRQAMAIDTDSRVRIPAELKSMVDSLLSDIDSQQKLASKKQVMADPFQVLTFLLPLKEKDQNARIKFYYPKKHKDTANKEFRVSLLLNMDRLGKIRTDLAQREKELGITFFVKDESHKNTLENHYPEINSALDPIYDYVILQTVVSKKKIDDFQREDLFISEDRRVDIKV